MTDETEVLRIKREALEGLRDWTRSRVETVRDVTQYLREVLPPHAPRKVRAKIMLHDFGEGSSKGFLHSQGSHDSWAVSYGDTILGIHRDDFARMAELVARADANGMVEEGLGESADKDRPPDEGATFAPAPSPAPETREWWLVLSNHDLRLLGVYPTRERASRVAVELLGSGCDAQSFPVVPRASLEATEAARRTDVATIQATADALYGDNNRPPAWQSGMPGAVGAMREERDQFQKAYDAAERHNTILRENVERHGDTIRTIRAQLREATGPVSRETVERMRDEYERSFWYHNEASSIAMSKALAVLGLTVEGA